MKRSFLVLFATLALALGVTGCSSVASRLRPPPRNTVALSILVNGTDQPNPAQWAALITMLEPTLVARGWVLVHDLSKASQIMRVNFIPDPAAPDTSGRAMVVGFMPNPRSGGAVNTAFVPRFPSGSSSGFSGYPGFSYRSSLHGWDDLGYSRYEPTFNPPPAVVVVPPINIPHCPPEYRGSARRDDSSRWHRDSPPSEYRRPSYSDNFPSSTSSSEPSSSPAPAPTAPLDYTPSSSSSVADHPTSG